MLIKKGDKQYNIPSWVIVLGLLVVDNAVVNVSKVIDNRNVLKARGKDKEKAH